MTGTLARLALATTVGLVLAGAAHAQMMTGVPNAMQGFSVNRDQPVHITSKTLEVRDKEKRATFIGDVHVLQGDTTMKSNTLDVFYDQESAPAQPKSAQPAPEGGQQIRRLEAKGNVVVTQKDQVATGETAVFDNNTNTVTLAGNVVVTQGPNILRGERLTVNMTTGFSQFEARPGGQVQGLFNTRQPKAPDSKGDAAPREPRADAKPTEARPTVEANGRPEGGRKDAAKPAARSAPGQPLRLN